MALCKQVTIAGLGLMGGSLGMALRRGRIAERVVGFSRRAATIAHAKRIGAIHAGSTRAEEAACDADLVVLAAPVDAIEPVARQLAPFLRPGCVVTDLGSSKQRIVRAIERAMPEGVAYVGSHPLAGSHERGLGAAHAALYRGSVCILTPTPRSDRRAIRRLTSLWSALSARVVLMDPAAHDRLLAAVSHLPHLLAFSLIQATAPEALPLAPKSFLDVTRVAKSDPDLWDDIILSNRQAILQAMGRFDRAWSSMRRSVSTGNRRQLQRTFRHAQRVRSRLDA